MKIFLNDHLLELLPASPAGTKPGVRITGYTGKSQFIKSIEQLERGDDINFVFYPYGMTYDEMESDFVAMFHFVEAAGGRVVNEKGELLVIFRYGRWDLPKGKIHFDKLSDPHFDRLSDPHFDKLSDPHFDRLSDRHFDKPSEHYKELSSPEWGRPGGGGETPKDAALREVMEETGLKNVYVGKELPATYHIFTHKGKRILKKTYWFEMKADSSQVLVPQTEEDISVVKWVSDLSEVLANTYASLVEIIRDAGCGMRDRI